ncbi:centromere protein H [Balearica regulorum gibbericeps]|uniref:centromere protein H n=1 Tax=Balearica regulorum gibbericeps TaxID=100784 RepID=UPI003F60F5E3
MESLQRELGAAAAEAEPEPEPNILMLLRLRDQMKQQLMECSAAVRAGQEICHGHILEENFTMNNGQDLQRNVEEAKVSFQNKTLALQRIQLMVALRNKMKQNDDDSRMIMETMKHIVKLSVAVIEYQQQAREKEQKLLDIKRKRLSLKKVGEQKLLQIHTMMKKQKEEQASVKVTKMMEKIHNDFERERQMTTIIQNVFQNIIIASRVNWAEDPSLREIVLQLEKNVNFI